MENRENKNIWYDDKYVIKKMLLTFRRNKLEELGTHDCIVKEKTIIKPHNRKNKHYVLFLETTDSKYSGMLPVKRNEYNKIAIDHYFGKCTIVKHCLRDEYYLVNEQIPDKALSKISFKSKMELLFLASIVLLFLFSIMLLLLN